MKIVKSISLFFVLPVILIGVGFLLGIKAMEFFYPGDQSLSRMEYAQNAEPSKTDALGKQSLSLWESDEEVMDAQVKAYGEVKAVAAAMETLCVDTEYVVQEVDIQAETMEETILRLPDKYVGMNREQFQEAMEDYQLSPPLSELERGFVSLEVISFARKQVVVQMNYNFVQPSKSFYLAVYNNQVVVYLEDKKTIYIETDILLESLSEELQREIINMLYVESEDELYRFLESYSS